MGLRTGAEHRPEAPVDSGLAAFAQVTTRQQSGSPQVTIEIGKLKPEIPALPSDAPEKALQDFGYQVSDALRSAGRRIQQDAGDPRWSFTSSTITAALKASELADVSEVSGVVRRRVSVTLEGSSQHVGSDFGNRVTRAVDSLSGEIAPWLGRVESGSVIKVTTHDAKPGDEVGRARTERLPSLRSSCFSVVWLPEAVSDRYWPESVRES